MQKLVVIGLVLAAGWLSACSNALYDQDIKLAHNCTASSNRAMQLIEVEDAGSGARAFIRQTYCDCAGILRHHKESAVDGGPSCQPEE